MKLLALLLTLSTVCPLRGQTALNVTLEAQINRGDTRYSGTWVYTDTDGREYALLGARSGTAVYDLDAAGLPEVAFIPGPVTRWREITVVGSHAYVVTDVEGANHSLQVIDLTALPATATLLTTYSTTFSKGHIIQRDILDPQAPYVYVCGTTTTQGVHLIDVSDPAQPFEVGLYAPGYYIHDCHVRGDRLYAAAFNDSTIDVVDISDKSAPQLLTRLPIPGGAVHSASLTTDGRYLFIASEQDGLPARIWNVEDLEDPYEVATYTANPQSLVHNPYIRDDFAFISHNTEGLRVVDLTDPTTPVEVGYYDTFEGPSGGFNGLWSACPYLPSGRIVGGNREDGLYLWQFNGQRAGRFYGTVIDSLTGQPLFNASVVLENADTLDVDPFGAFRGGALPGSYTLTVTVPGYVGKTFTLALSAGDQQDITAALAPLSTDTRILPKEQQLLLSPNPFRESATITWNRDSKPVRLQLIDAEGRIVRNDPVRGDITFDLPRRGLPAGLYVLLLFDAKGKVTGRERLQILP